MAVVPAAKLRLPLDLRPLPRPGRPSPERRLARAGTTVDAMRAALDAAAERGACDVIIVADDDGMLVCSSETPLELDMLAAVTPIIARGEARATVKRAGRVRELSVHTVSVLGESLHVAVLGGRRSERVRELATAVAATRRILEAA